MSITKIWTQTLAVDPRSGTNSTTPEFSFTGEHVLVQVALSQVSASANVSITKVVDGDGETRGIDKYLILLKSTMQKMRK